ncbi:uracil-DNA glycosylase [Mucilaginibacter sp. ZT4R22]|uniref:Uracil-DNA glycosylase n=1 Tax=Mucilaginibacter pankratovii TaxID=2772110 RepID=A0ABR7WVP9_9SPHI|nr:uracil-DNA glycosylase family protein [Mucilaginibacter pankratovii]MBD1365494.1 uracil-DNA glycosylase [Mucilaginibacter pankratovii]
MDLFNGNEFNILSENVQNCVLCPRMCNVQKILNRSAGFLNAELMFIGEAPGRLGADSSGIPFHGDKAGHNFEELLEFANINRSNIFVTNAVLCNPRDENGNNSTPTKTEIQNCSKFLEEQIKLVNPKIVVTLGGVALESLNYISKHDLTLRDSVRTANKWFDRLLIPLYHPGQRAMIHRSMANQRSDYQFIADTAKNFTKKKNKSYGTIVNVGVVAIINYLFEKKDSFTYFALHKLFYLIEYKSVLKFGFRLTNSYIVRQKDGPYCTELHILKIKKALSYLDSKVLSASNILIYKNASDLFSGNLNGEYPELDKDVKALIDEILLEHGNKSNAALKRTVYFSRPMRNILAAERDNNINLYNTPISFTL